MSATSDNYEQVKEHYQALLSQHYTWTFGGLTAKINTNIQLLQRFLERKPLSCIDLGCGSGFQTIPLLQMGYKVIAIDACSALLEELENETQRLIGTTNALQAVQGDLLEFRKLTQQTTVDVCVCMGDTITHLASLNEVERLLRDVYQALVPRGILILSFTDLTQPLHGSDRFIPVRSDERTVYTCFLEWQSAGSGCTIQVTDLVHVKKGIRAWELCKSSYKKLGISGNYLKKMGESIGFECTFIEVDLGNVLLVLQRP